MANNAWQRNYNTDPFWIRGGEGKYDPHSASGMANLARQTVERLCPAHGSGDNAHPSANQLRNSIAIIGDMAIGQNDRGFRFAAGRFAGTSIADMITPELGTPDFDRSLIRTAHDAVSRLDNIFLPLSQIYKGNGFKGLKMFHDMLGMKMVQGFRYQGGNLGGLQERVVEAAFPLVFGHRFNVPQVHFPYVPAFAPREGSGRKRRGTSYKHKKKRRRY